MSGSEVCKQLNWLEVLNFDVLNVAVTDKKDLNDFCKD